MALMEGILWKWTNYLSGWQPRYFVLEVGVLAYYKSQEEVGQGSRGSIKMSCCEISVHPSDTVRIDLKIPPVQFLYLRAATAAERQQWLVALGTAKACITQGPATRTPPTPVDTTNLTQLKEKMEELNTYRSLLMQQINTIKLMCTEKEDNQEFSEAGTMLSATCDEFLKNLCDCMEIAETHFRESPPSSPTSSLSSVNLSTSKHSTFRKHLLHESHRSPPLSPTSSVASSSFGSVASGSSSTPTSEKPTQKVTPPRSSLTPSPSTSTSSVCTVDKGTRHPRQPPLASYSPQAPRGQQRNNTHGQSQINSVKGHSQNINMHGHQQNNVHGNSQNNLMKMPLPSGTQDAKEPSPPTFFSTASPKFEEVNVTPEGGIPTKAFLAACTGILPFFDVLGSTAFAPVKMDISGNIKKLLIKFDTDPKAFYTLHNIVYQELKSNTCTAKNSATDALLWLKRALEFMQIFLLEVVKGREDLAVAAGIAYEKSLRRYHGWVVRGVFALAVKAVPYREDFLKTLGTTSDGVAPNDVVLRDMRSSVTSLGGLLQNLNHFYLAHKLDSSSTV